MGAFETRPTFDGLSDATINPVQEIKGASVKFIRRMNESWAVEIPPSVRYYNNRPPHVWTDRNDLVGKDIRLADRSTSLVEKNRFSKNKEDHYDSRVVTYTLCIYENGNPGELLMDGRYPAHLIVYYGPDGSHVDTY